MKEFFGSLLIVIISGIVTFLNTALFFFMTACCFDFTFSWKYALGIWIIIIFICALAKGIKNV